MAIQAITLAAKICVFTLFAILLLCESQNKVWNFFT